MVVDFLSLTICVAFVLKIWRGRSDEPFRKCLEWCVDLKGLRYTGDKVCIEGKRRRDL